MYKLGYTTGIFDLFHIGHLNLINNAAAQCERLIVGVSTDELTWKLKHKAPIIPFEERIEIVRNIKSVHSAIAEEIDDKLDMWNTLKFDAIFKGDDWQNTPKWAVLKEEFRKRGVDLIFFPYTQSTSSTLINHIISQR